MTFLLKDHRAAIEVWQKRAVLTNNSIKYHFTPQAGVRICIDFYDHSKPIECECAILPKRSICKCWSRSLYKDSVSLHNKGRIATVAKIKERKSSQEGEGNYHPSFVSNRGSIVWHLNSMRSEDGNFPFCECRLRIQDNWHWARICMHLKFIDIDRLDYCLLIFNLYFLIFYLGSWRLPIAVSWSAAHHQSVIHHFDGFFAFCVTFVFACLHDVPPRGKVTRISVIESFILTERSLGNFCIRFGKGNVSRWEARFKTP